MADSLITITIGLHEAPATVAERCLRGTGSHFTSGAVKPLAEELIAIASGVRDGKVTARVDSVTRGAASQTVTCDNATATAGDLLHITIPGFPRYSLTAVSGSATAASGEYSIDTSDAAMATSLAAAINALPGLSRHVSAEAASDVVTITARQLGTWAHSIALVKDVTNSGALTLGGSTMSGGDDVLAQPSLVVTFGAADIAANDTTSIGAIEYTWVASASATNEITLSTTPATAASNFAAKINADTRWTGLLSASADDDDVTLTWLGDPRAGQHVVCTIAVTNSGSIALGGTEMIAGAESLVLGTTVTGSSTCRTFGGKGAA